MPPIQDAGPTSLFNHIDLAILKEWDDRPGGKVLAIPFNMDIKTIETHNLFRSKILTAVTEIITTQEASIAAPKPSTDTVSKSKTPTSFLIYNITQEQATFLLERKVWSSRAITFQVAPFEFTCPSFLFAIKELSTLQPKDVYPIVKTILESEATRVFVETLINDTPDDEKEKTVHDICLLLSSMSLERLDIKEVGNNLCPRFNVYADFNNFTKDKIWECLRTFLREAIYISPMEALPAATVKIPFICMCCHSVDHPRGLCPFPSLPGWNGPKRELTDPYQRRNSSRMSGPLYVERRTQRQIFTPRG